MGEVVFVYGLFCTSKRHADCELRTVICFMNGRNDIPAEIISQIGEFYCENVMWDGMVR